MERYYMKTLETKVCKVCGRGGLEPKVDQGKVHGFSVSWNPDDSLFYLHANDEEETILARRHDWQNIVHAAKLLSLKR